MGLFDDDDEIKKIIKAELEYLKNDNFRDLEIPSVYQQMILNRKKILVTNAKNAKTYFDEKKTMLNDIRIKIENRFKEDYADFKKNLGVKNGKILSIRSVKFYEQLLLEGFEVIYPKELDEIAERALINNAKKNNLY